MQRCSLPFESLNEYTVEPTDMLSLYTTVSYGFTNRKPKDILPDRMWFFDFTIIPSSATPTLTFQWDKTCILQETELGTIGFFKRSVKGYFVYQNTIKAITNKKYIEMTGYGVDPDDVSKYFITFSFDFSSLSCPFLGKEMTFSFQIFDGSCPCGSCCLGNCYVTPCNFLTQSCGNC